MEYRQNLKGWQAAAVALGILGVVIYQCARRIQTLDESARFAIGVSLVREYRGTGLKQQVQEFLKQKAGGAPREPAPSAEPIPHVELALVGAHGSKDVMVVKVKVKVNGGPPPDGRSIRYLDLMRSTTDGRWMVVADSDASYYIISLLSPVLGSPGAGAR
jgi:hypothetical protein